jgi:two-component system, sporulation sensor kinase E
MMPEPDLEAFFRSLVMHSPVVVSVVEPDGTWLWSPRGRVQLLGEENNLGYSVPEVDKQRLVELVSNVANNKPWEPIDLDLQGPDDKWYVLRVTAENMLGDANVHGIVLYGTNITPECKAKEEIRLQKAYVETIVTSVNVGILMHDSGTHSVIAANDAFIDLFKVSKPAKELIGKPITTLYSLSSNLFVEQAASDIRGYSLISEGKQAMNEHWVLKDGRTIARDYVPVYLDDVLKAHLWIFRDVTGRV